jgi:pimeloyl-ACP methyl ester carboxylesterase
VSAGDPTLVGPGAAPGLGAAAGPGAAVADRGAVAGPAALERVVEAAGPADAPALLLLHGTRRTRAMWRHQLDGLADGFRVLALDLPGHGTLADVPFRLADATDLAAAVIEALPAGRAVVVGSSLGGYVGMDLAARRPGLVAGLVLVNASAEPRFIALHAPRTVGSYLARAASDRLCPRSDGAPGGAGMGGDGDGTGRRDGEVEAPATKGWLFRGGGRAIVAALRESFLPRLAAYPGPTLIVNGADDALFRSEERAFLAAAVDGRIELIDGTGHLANEEQPAAFNAVVRRFVAEVHAPDRPADGA